MPALIRIPNLLPCFYLLVLSGCVTGPYSKGVDTTETPQEVQLNRLEFVLRCVGLDPNTLEANRETLISKKEGEKCQTEAKKKYPIPPNSRSTDIVGVCMEKNGIPTDATDSNFEGTPEQIDGFNECIDELLYN